MRNPLTAASAALIAVFFLAACSGPSGDAAVDKPVTKAAPSVGAPVREAEIRPVTEGTVAEPAPVADAPVEPAPAPVVANDAPEVRDAKSAAEEAARKFFDATREAAAAIKEAGKEAVESVRGTPGTEDAKGE